MLPKYGLFCKSFSFCRGRSIVDFPIGDHVNVLSNYKETVSEKNLKCLRSHYKYNRVTDILIKFRPNHI